jgi:hypothetical protein
MNKPQAILFTLTQVLLAAVAGCALHVAATSGNHSLTVDVNPEPQSADIHPE